MSRQFWGSICVTDIIEHFKQKHSSFTKGNNGKVYMNIQVWVNEKEDDYGNTMSIKSNVKKDKKDIEKNFYIGNCKETERKETPPSNADVNDAEQALSDVGDGLAF